MPVTNPLTAVPLGAPDVTAVPVNVAAIFVVLSVGLIVAAVPLQVGLVVLIPVKADAFVLLSEAAVCV